MPDVQEAMTNHDSHEEIYVLGLTFLKNLSLRHGTMVRFSFFSFGFWFFFCFQKEILVV